MKYNIHYLATEFTLHKLIESKAIPSLIILLLVGIIHAVHSALFLSFYYRLVRQGKQAKGVIVSFDRGGSLFFRSILVPVVSFITEDDSGVEGLPEFSNFTQLNSFSRQQEVTVCYQEDNPKSFVIISETEVEANWAMIIGFIGCVLVGLLIYRITW